MPPLLRWCPGVNRTLWMRFSLIQPTRPSLPARPPPTNQTMASLAPAAARWLSPQEGKSGDGTSWFLDPLCIGALDFV